MRPQICSADVRLVSVRRGDDTAAQEICREISGGGSIQAHVQGRPGGDSGDSNQRLGMTIKVDGGVVARHSDTMAA